MGDLSSPPSDIGALADFGYPVKAFWFYCSQTLNYLVFQSVDFDLPDEGYSTKVSCALNLISTFLFYHSLINFPIPVFWLLL